MRKAVFPDDYADILTDDTPAMTPAQSRSFLITLAVSIAARRDGLTARGRRNPALPLPARKVTGESQRVKPNKRKPAPRVRVDRSPAVKP